MTIRRTIVILLLLAIVFFIYRAVSPDGADRLLWRIKEAPSSIGIDIPALETPALVTWTVLTGKVKPSVIPVVSQKTWVKVIAFSSSLHSGWTFAIESLLISPEKDIFAESWVTTGGSLTIIQTTWALLTSTVPAVKPSAPTVVHHTPSPRTPARTSSSTSSDIQLLNALFK